MCGLQAGHQFTKSGATDDDQVHVTCGLLLLTRKRAVHKCHPDTATQGQQCFPQYVHDSRGFDDQSLQFNENWTFAVGLIEDPVAALRPAKNSRLFELLDLSLHRTDSCVCRARDLA